MKEDLELGRRLIAEMEAAGFHLDVAFTDQISMVRGIREIAELSSGSVLSSDQQLALLENLRLTKEAMGAGFVPSIERQCRLPRWRFLREVSPAAAEAYWRALRLAGIEPPPHLLG